MNGLASVKTRDSDPIIAKAKADRRRYRRVRVDLPGRLFMPVGEQEARCKILDLSPGGAGVQSEVHPPEGSQVVLYVDGFGRFEGNVARPIDGGFGVQFASTQLKRERTAEQLTLFMNRDLLDESDLRRHERAPQKGLTHFTRTDGQRVVCEVLDLSVSGVSLKTDIRPPVGEYVLIGHMAGRVARHHENGIGIEFVGGVERGSPEKLLNGKLSIVR
jgi:hypothetical protein